MNRREYDNGYGVDWTEVCVYDHEGYGTSVSDYHEHPFYEVNLVLSGEIKVLFADRMEQGGGHRVILTSPETPHYISCERDVLYRRKYLLFGADFLSAGQPTWRELLSVFGERGQCLTVSEEQTETCCRILDAIGEESDRVRRQLLIFYFLSYLKDCAKEQSGETAKLPHYVMEALSYIERHFAEKIVAADLAQRLYVGRTSLMVGFKRYTGMTIHEYALHCRLRQSAELLREGVPEQEISERCGFCDVSGMIKSFRRVFGMTPTQYRKKNSNR